MEKSKAAAKVKERTEKQMERQKVIAIKDREYDSDDEHREQMLTFDDRLGLINKLDYQNFKN